MLLRKRKRDPEWTESGDRDPETSSGRGSGSGSGVQNLCLFVKLREDKLVSCPIACEIFL